MYTVYIGSNLKKLRKAKVLTLQDICDKTGLTQGYLSRLENGEFGNGLNLTLETILLLADVFGLSLEDFCFKELEIKIIIQKGNSLERN